MSSAARASTGSASRSRSTELAAALALAVSVAACAGCASGAAKPKAAPAPHSPFRGVPTLPMGVATDFALKDQHRRVVRLSQQRGRVVLLTFLYTSCPDTCPITAAKLSTAVRALGPLASRVRIIAVSVDPQNDTPAHVRRFIAKLRLPSQFHYLTGTPAQLRPVWQAYNVLVERRNVERVDHSVPVVAIGVTGRPRVVFPQTSTPADISHDVRLLLARRV